MEAQALDWIEANLGEPLDRKKPYDDLLKDGIILCKYVRLKRFLFFFSFFFTGNIHRQRRVVSRVEEIEMINDRSLSLLGLCHNISTPARN